MFGTIPSISTTGIWSPNLALRQCEASPSFKPCSKKLTADGNLTWHDTGHLFQRRPSFGCVLQALLMRP
jgi:hypothetical protein